MVRKTSAQNDRSTASASADCSPRIQSVWRALDRVADPEIPTLGIVELGMIADVREDDGCIVVDLTPTFAGCPALELIQHDIRKALTEAGFASATINVVYNPPWTTERISDEGRRKLKEFGLAPPGMRCEGGTPDLQKTPCPYCDSTDTELESIFGPTLCRSIHYCRSCSQSFEHFKAV